MEEVVVTDKRVDSRGVRGTDVLTPLGYRAGDRSGIARLVRLSSIAQIMVGYVLTHAEYDKDKWKDDRYY